MRSPSKRSVTLVLLSALLATGLWAAGPGAVPSHAEEEPEVVLSIQEQISVADLLKTIGQLLKRPLVWDPTDKQIRGKQVVGAVDIRTSHDELLPAVRSLLTFYELVLIPVGPEKNQVMLVMDARRTTSILKLKAEPVELNERNLERYAGADGLYITTMIEAPHLDDLRAARNALTRIVTGQNIGNVTEVPAARAFVVTDFAPNVVSIYRLVKQMDEAAQSEASAPASRVFRAVSLKHARARDAMSILTPLFSARPVNRAAARGGPQPMPVADDPRVMADDRTNQLLVTGSQGDVEQILEAIATIDVPAPAPSVSAHLIQLEHLNAHEAASELNAMIGASQLLWRAAGDNRLRPSVVGSQRINALLISADGDAFEEIRRLIQEMDERAGEDEAAADK